MKKSKISGFYKLNVDQRLKIVKEFAELTDGEVDQLKNTGALNMEIANRMVENVIGSVPIPLGIATNFLINNKDYLIPMAIEETSVIAAASYAARMARKKGGFFTSSTNPIMIGQIEVVNVKDPHKARLAILKSKEKILEKANAQDPILLSLGGGAQDLRVRIVGLQNAPILVAELLVDCKDAMGANAVNTMSEAIAPLIEKISQGSSILKIISNLATERIARAWTIIDKDEVGGERIVDRILKAHYFAESDPYRAATHNKGIFNGIIAVVIATFNDHRAVEAGGHAYASRNGTYLPLSKWEKNVDGDLVGSIELPLPVGIIGGAITVHPISKIALKILGVKTARELSEILAAVGLAQNLAALRALSDEGIQKGHMSLHARNIAIMAGAIGKQIDTVAEKMVKDGKIRLDRAKEFLKNIEQ